VWIAGGGEMKKKALGWIILGTVLGIILYGLISATGVGEALSILSTASILTFLTVLGLHLILE